MSIASEITRIKTNIENAYTKAEEKGATMPEVRNSNNLASCVESITTSGGGSVLNVVPKGQIDNGVLTFYKDISGVFDDIVSINGFYALAYGFYRNTSLTGFVSFPKLTFIDTYGLTYCFYNCKNITGVNFNSLSSVNADGLNNCFFGCTNITEANFESLEIIRDGGLTRCFYGCSNLTEVNFDSLNTVTSGGLSQTFYNCTSLTSISFPSLRYIVSTSGWGDTFYGCSNLTEIHFRVDMQSTVEKLTGYSTKFGATNATIYFDL